MVVGLGNPGPSYSATRHNVGFLVVRRVLAQAGGVRLRPAFGGLVGSGRVQDSPVVFCLPMSYMNRSGTPVGDLSQAVGVESQNVLVVHDDLDLPFGTVRCKKSGGHGGHNGLRDIARRIGREHPRVRFGIGRPPSGISVSDHVLGDWTDAERDNLEERIDNAAAAVKAILESGLEQAMNQFNVRSPSGSGHPPSETPKTLD
ncbi:MAG: aminoacyl-tRNA hydrolase [Deltaproteobacteria bacterium]|nr:aminoacyl-tRNA hydrolase [Deltaproteobacteria bacterium]